MMDFIVGKWQVSVYFAYYTYVFLGYLFIISNMYWEKGEILAILNIYTNSTTTTTFTTISINTIVNISTQP